MKKTKVNPGKIAGHSLQTAQIKKRGVSFSPKNQGKYKDKSKEHSGWGGETL